MHQVRCIDAAAGAVDAHQHRDHLGIGRGGIQFLTEQVHRVLTRREGAGKVAVQQDPVHVNYRQPGAFGIAFEKHGPDRTVVEQARRIGGDPVHRFQRAVEGHLVFGLQQQRSAATCQQNEEPERDKMAHG